MLGIQFTKPAPRLPSTGAPAGGLLLAAVLLVALGAGVLLPRRARRTKG